MKIETDLDLKIAVIGLLNAGKTSTISSFLQMDIGSEISPVVGETKYRRSYERSYEENGVCCIDTPGFQNIDHINKFFESNESMFIKDYIKEYKLDNTRDVRRNVETFKAIEKSDFVICVINADQDPNENDRILVEMVKEYILKEKPTFFFINEYKENSWKKWEEYLKNEGIRYIRYDAHKVTIENSINVFEYFKQGIEDDRIKKKCERLIRSIRDDFNKKLEDIIKEIILEFHFTFENYECVDEPQAVDELCKKLNKLAKNCIDKIHSKFNFEGGLEEINIPMVDVKDVTSWLDELLNKIKSKIPIYRRIIPNRRTFVINDQKTINKIFDNLISKIFAIILCSHARTGRPRESERERGDFTIRNGEYLYELKNDADYNQKRNAFFKKPKAEAKRDELTKYIVSKICEKLKISTCDG